ncbi:TPA: ammonia monooxygenase, partial [Enterococcus faecium]
MLLSLYDKEKPEYLKEALTSIFEQTVMPKEIVLVYDGPI